MSAGFLPFLVVLGSLILSITIHEFAHAFAADLLGDPTPKLQGRLTLDPRAHLDPIGTLMIIFTWFGWGKPVMFDPYNLRNPRKDAALISLAGPVSNLILALLLSMLIRLASLPLLVSVILISMIRLNVILAIFNLVPIHPLDGGKIILGLLPKDLAYEYNAVLSQYGTVILLFMILPLSGSSPISLLISPIVDFVFNILIP
jgi:Zn-dependent protease